MPKIPSKTTNKKVWYSEGLQFACQGSGKCCTSHGEFGFVYLSLKDRKALALFHGLSERDFRLLYCRQVDGFWALKDAGPKQANPNDCQFLKDKRCTVYEARPTQCRTWPFWPEVMNPRKWKKDVEAFCPGVNKGEIKSQKEIDLVLAEQVKNELEMQIEQAKKPASKNQ
jgi:Fe-S-cluster containining protein